MRQKLARSFLKDITVRVDHSVRGRISCGPNEVCAVTALDGGVTGFAELERNSTSAAPAVISRPTRFEPAMTRPLAKHRHRARQRTEPSGCHPFKIRDPAKTPIADLLFRNKARAHQNIQRADKVLPGQRGFSSATDPSLD